VVNEFDRIINVIGEKGYETGSMHYPTFMKLGPNNKLFISDSLNTRVQVFNSQGAPELTIGEGGLGIGQFLRPKGLAIDGLGFLYSADSGHNVIQVFNKEGHFAALLGNEKGLPIDLGSPNGILFVEPDRLYIAEKLARRIQVRKVVLDRQLTLLADDLREKGFEVPADTKKPRKRTQIKSSPARFGAQIEKIRLLKERGGLVTITAPIFKAGGSVLVDGAIDVLNEITVLVEDPNLTLKIKVLAVNISTKKVSPSLAKDRIMVITKYVPGGPERVRFYTMGAVTQGNLQDMIEITVEKSR
jgi:hypothetical protein